MAQELDPHHLVALMNFSFGKHKDSSVYQIDHTSYDLEYGISDVHETNFRIFPVLDALAMISVSRPRSQSVAIGLQVQSEKKQIRLTIANNTSVPPGLVPHIRNIWGKLQNLSDIYEKERILVPERQRAKSPEVPSDVALSLKVEIIRDLYLFSIAKQMKRMQKWWDHLGSFMKYLVARRQNTSPEGIESYLHNAIIGMFLVQQLVMKLHDKPGSYLIDEEWETIYLQSMWANENARLVLTDRDGCGCEILTEGLYDNILRRNPQYSFPLRHVLERLTTLPREFDALVSFAHSPRLRKALLYQLSVIAIPGVKNAVQFPTSPAQWRNIIEAVSSNPHQWQPRKPASFLFQKFPSAQYSPTVHAECRLIEYLSTKHDTPWDDVLPFNYIGVSKPTCGACNIWIEGFNEFNRCRFYTRTACRNWSWPWGMPRGQNVLEKRIAQKLLDEYTMQERETNRYGVRSISDLRVDDVQGSLTKAEMESADSEAAALEQWFGDGTSGFLEAAFPHLPGA